MRSNELREFSKPHLESELLQTVENGPQNPTIEMVPWRKYPGILPASASPPSDEVSVMGNHLKSKALVWSSLYLSRKK